MNLQRSMNWMWTWHRPWAPQGARPELQPQEEVVVPEPDLQVALMDLEPQERVVERGLPIEEVAVAETERFNSCQSGPGT